MGTSAHDRYYEPEDDNDDEIRFRTDELMRTHRYDAFQLDNIMEAISDIGLKDAEDLQAVLDTHDYTAIGKKIWDVTYTYMEKYALSQAIDEIENEDRE